MIPNDFLERMKNMEGLDFGAFCTALEGDAVRAFRVNTLKTDAGTLLPLLPFSAEPLPFAADAYYAPDTKVGAHPAHHAGMMYMQDPSAISAVAAACPQRGERVLDLCAAPGGKSTQLAAAVAPDGVLVANEYVTARCRILEGNIERLGVSHAVVTNLSTDKLAVFYGPFFDLVVADVPCSGEGMFRKYEVAGEEWSLENVTACAVRGRGILEDAAACVADGGRLLYSTCTFSLDENEHNVDAFLTAHPEFSLIPVPDTIRENTADGINFKGHRHDMTPCRRFYPHISPGEGQFVALFKKKDTGVGAKQPSGGLDGRLSKADAATVEAFLRDTLMTVPAGKLLQLRDTVYLAPDIPIPKGGVFAAGVPVGTLTKGRVVPHHHFYSAYGKLFLRQLPLSHGDSRVEKYLSGEELDVPELGGARGFVAVLFENAPLGGGKLSDAKLKNHYPKGLRNR